MSRLVRGAPKAGPDTGTRPGSPRPPDLRAWRPRVPGVPEVLHARFHDHVYPMHAHDTWALLLVDHGAVRYHLGRHEHGAGDRRAVTLLPPHVPHDGRAATDGGFRKRVIYLDTAVLGTARIGAAADLPDLADPLLRRRIEQLHTALNLPGEELEAESRLALVVEHLGTWLDRRTTEPRHPIPHPNSGIGPIDVPRLAHRLRDLLDAHLPTGLTLADAAARLHAHPTSLVRAFRAAFGQAPHQYVVSRRVDLARRLLLDGLPTADVAGAAAFHDQPHLTRHFRRLLGTTPARFARSGGRDATRR